MRKLLLLFSLFISEKAVSQSEGGAPGSIQTEFPVFKNNILPPSPDAYQFTRQGNLPIGLSTGTAQFTLPIYTIQSGSLNHSISLNYATNGVRVDEMATRAGINWNLTVGGAITRSIMDKADGNPGILPVYYHGDGITTDTSWTFYNYIRQASYAGAPDFEPDEYSFNMDGYSGKFLRRENGEFTQFKSSGIKIEKNGSGFVLTTNNGNKYFFYEKEDSKTVTYPLPETFEAGSLPATTAWYLTKILSVSHDSIVFNYSALSSSGSTFKYKNGISESFGTSTWANEYFPNVNLLPNGTFRNNCFSPNPPGLQTSVSMTETNPVYLTSIIFNLGNITLTYSDREDVDGEKKLDQIIVTRTSDNKIIKEFSLEHIYSFAALGGSDLQLVGHNYSSANPETRKRLFLTGVSEFSNDIAIANKHRFDYDNIDALPPRFSFSQDLFGFYNGKLNTYYFPNDTYLDYWIGNIHFGGDRSYDFNYAKYGTLKKITYPSGGSTVFEYEPHKTEMDYAFVHHKDSTQAILDTSSVIGQEVYSGIFHNTGQHVLRFKGFCEWATAPVSIIHNGAYIDLEDQFYVTIYILDINTNACQTICGSTLMVGNSFIDGLNVFTNLPGGDYRIKIVANRPHLRARVTMEETWDTPDRSEFSGIAGVRVKTIADYASNGIESNRREFLYTAWDNPNAFTGTGLDYPNYASNVSTTRVLGTDGMGHKVYCGYNTIHSNSLINNYRTDNNTVFYTKVIELNSSTNNKNNGGTEYDFNYRFRFLARPMVFNTWPAYVWDAVPELPPGAPYDNNDIETGTTKKVTTFTYSSKYGTRSILQESENTYSMDLNTLIVDSFFSSRLERKRDISVPAWPYFADYRIYKYYRYFGFFKLDKTVTKVFSGGQALVSQVEHSYSPRTFLLSESRTTTSGQKPYSVFRSFIGDITSAYPDYLSLYQPMIQQNLTGKIAYETVTKNYDVMSNRRMQFAYWPDINLYLPSQALSSIRFSPEVVDVTFNKYDTQGNLLQFTGRDGVVTSIIYGYNYAYPVAKVVGRPYADVLSQSGINMSIINNPPSDAAMRTELNKIRTLVTGTVLVSTLTYEPLIGVTSETDANGKTIYYSYDDFNRLRVIRDKDNNLLKQFEYNFAGPGDAAAANAASWTATGNVRCKLCTVDPTYHTNLQEVEQKDVNPTSPTYNTLQWVDNGVSAACPVEDGYVVINSECLQNSGVNTGVLRLTKKGMNPCNLVTYNVTVTEDVAGSPTCPVGTACNTTNCTGEDKKCVNGVCETGVKHTLTSIRLNSTTWQCTYNYTWSDSSTSPTYTETTTGSCAVFELE